MCSLLRLRNIEVVGRFMREHTEIINASGVLRAAARRGLADAIAAAATGRPFFAPHSAAEEAGIFTVMAEDPEFTDYVTRLLLRTRQLNATWPPSWRRLTTRTGTRHARVQAPPARAHRPRGQLLFPAAAVALAGPEVGTRRGPRPDA